MQAVLNHNFCSLNASVPTPGPQPLVPALAIPDLGLSFLSLVTVLLPSNLGGERSSKSRGPHTTEVRATRALEKKKVQATVAGWTGEMLE